VIRVGIGYDCHRFVPGGPLVLGGIRIPFDKHLDGHSDADHAACAGSSSGRIV
jgi:2-C-methyl-D-erythritol 2,4-cyclodiphosphate synthase